MLTIEQIREALKDRNISAVQRACGLSYPVVWHIKNGTAKQPSYETIKKLSDYLEKK